MLKKTITYTDYYGEERTEDFYFHLTPAKLTELEMSVKGGMKNYLDRAIKEKNGPIVMEAFKKLIRMSYGVKSNDGRRFMQSDEIWNEFAETEAYVTLFMELVTDENAAKAFADKIMPDMSKWQKPAQA